MQKFQFITLDTILAKYHRDFRNVGINEGDAIEWIGEALGFMKITSASEEAVAFMEVKNYEAQIPNGMHYIIQVARNNSWSREDNSSCCTENIISELFPELPEVIPPVPIDCHGSIIGDYGVAYYRPFFDLQYEYLGWAQSKYKARHYTPVKLSNHSFFNSIVCKENDIDSIYHSCQDEYTIVQDKLRFSFKEGFIALAYLRQKVDLETGYPMIPDDESAKAAITYYLGWKVKEQEGWNHREGAMNLAGVAETKWLKYVKQFKNKAKMPQGADQYENLMQASKYLIPRQHRYSNYFGGLGKAELRPFNDPDRRNYIGNYGYGR